MLLMQSDMLKSTWFMIYPIVELSQGGVKSESAFCQISGFFLAAGIEACDVAVVLVALHTALCIFHWGSSNGLQPYRRIAYALFVAVPLLLASLAFVNKPGYANSGEYCYLPLHPDWARRSLSWIPRYIIFATILIIYAFIYIRVAFLMRRYGQRWRSKDNLAGQRRRSGIAPPLPRISTHGLIPSIVSSRRTSVESKGRHESLFSPFGTSQNTGSRRPSGASATQTPGPRRSGQLVRWKLPHFGADSAPQVGNSSLRNTPEESGQREANAAGESPTIPAPSAKRWNKPAGSASRTSRHTRSPSQTNLLAILKRGPHSSSSRTTSSVFLSPTTGMTEMRENVVRQMRYLFVYPLVYLGVWLVPFISHLMGGDRLGAPFGVIITGLVSLSIQGFADAVVFSLREKPWRDDGASTENRHPWWHCHDDQYSVHGTNTGRSTEDMVSDRRVARWRLDAELAERRLERLTDRPTTLDWWDCEHQRVLMSVDSISEHERHVTDEGTELPDRTGAIHAPHVT
jgi:G protein-coupled receptor GPR1